MLTYSGLGPFFTICTPSSECGRAGTYPLPMKSIPDSELRFQMCTRKRRYPNQGKALEAAMLAGVERQRVAYRCAVCGKWHLATRGRRR